MLTTHTESLRLTRRGKPRQTSRSTAQARGPKDALSIQTLRVSDYILQLLRGEAVATSQLGKPLTSAAYVALLPAIWALLNNAIPDLQGTSSAVLQATLDHSLRTSSKSGVKGLTIGFISRLVLVGAASSCFFF